MQTVKGRIGILKGVNAKQHIIIRELFDQQTDLIKFNVRNNILFHNLPEGQNPDGLYNDHVSTRSIINKILVEVMELIER